MIDPDATYTAICAPETPVRERVQLALELLVWLAVVGDMSHTQLERKARAEVCKAVLLAELDSYQTLLNRMENR